jgi:hypothetical protein
MDGCHEVASSPHHFITLNVLVDLGSGDGRVALTAAQMNPKTGYYPCHTPYPFSRSAIPSSTSISSAAS